MVTFDAFRLVDGNGLKVAIEVGLIGGQRRKTQAGEKR